MRPLTVTDLDITFGANRLCPFIAAAGLPALFCHGLHFFGAAGVSALGLVGV